MDGARWWTERAAKDEKVGLGAAESRRDVRDKARDQFGVGDVMLSVVSETVGGGGAGIPGRRVSVRTGLGTVVSGWAWGGGGSRTLGPLGGVLVATWVIGGRRALGGGWRARKTGPVVRLASPAGIGRRLRGVKAPSFLRHVKVCVGRRRVGRAAARSGRCAGEVCSDCLDALHEFRVAVAHELRILLRNDDREGRQEKASIELVMVG